MTQNKTQKKYILWISVALALVTAITYSQACLNDFLNFDDDVYVTENPRVTSGLNLKSVKWAFAGSHSDMWHPLNSMSHILDCQLFGLDPVYHHLHNLLLHVINTLLLFTVLRKMTGKIWQSAIVTALFAFHPLQVESVAWVSERKNLLSAFFWLLTIAAYIRYAKNTSIRRYLLVTVTFILALMSKPVTVTLPFALLLLDYWPLNRFQLTTASKISAKSNNLRLILEKIPLLFLSAAVCVITFIVQKTGGAVKESPVLSLDIRLANAVVSYLKYILKIFYPTKLAILYPHPFNTLGLWKPLLALAILILITAAVIYLSRKYRYLPTGWFWFLGTLIPVIGIIQAGDQAMADRYVYIPAIGIFIILVWGCDDLFHNIKHKKILLALVSFALATMLALTQKQLTRWKTNLTLFGYTLSVTENNYIMHNNYGNALAINKQLDQAVYHFQEAVRIHPFGINAKNNLGNAYMLLGKPRQAIRQFTEILTLDPNHLVANYNMAVTLSQIPRQDLAIVHFRKVLDIDPNYSKAMTSIAWILATTKNNQLRNPSEALKLAQKACRLTNYSRPELLDVLAVSYAAAGNFEQAVKIAENAANLAASTGPRKLYFEIQKRLQLYRNRKPYRQ